MKDIIEEIKKDAWNPDGTCPYSKIDPRKFDPELFDWLRELTAQPGQIKPSNRTSWLQLVHINLSEQQHWRTELEWTCVLQTANAFWTIFEDYLKGKGVKL